MREKARRWRDAATARNGGQRSYYVPTGRPVGRPGPPDSVIQRARELHALGHSYREIADILDREGLHRTDGKVFTYGAVGRWIRGR